MISCTYAYGIPVNKIHKTIQILTVNAMLIYPAFGFDWAIQNIIRDVNIDSMMKYTREITGDVAVEVGSEQVLIRSRNRDFPGNALAADYMQALLEKWGYSVQLQDYSQTGRNVIATLTGSSDPDRCVILCAHYDSMPHASVAPGADDNASGTVAVLEAARILAGRTCNYSILFALWDEEEYGYWGSDAFVQNFPSEEKEIISAINLDMIAWDADDDDFALIGTGGIPSCRLIADVALDVCLEYKIGLLLDVTETRIYSDQTTFHNAGHPAIGLHENFFGDMNDFYHQSEDVIDHFNADYFQKISQLLVGTACVLAGLEPDSDVEEPVLVSSTFQLDPNYPNPFNSVTVIPITLSESGYLKVEVFDLLGRRISVLADGYYHPGLHAFSFYAAGLPSGVYTCRVITETSQGTQKMLFLK